MEGDVVHRDVALQAGVAEEGLVVEVEGGHLGQGRDLNLVAHVVRLVLQRDGLDLHDDVAEYVRVVYHLARQVLAVGQVQALHEGGERAPQSQTNIQSSSGDQLRVVVADSAERPVDRFRWLLI